MKVWFVCLFALVALSDASSQEKREEYLFPAKDQIALMLTQAERAFDTYEETMKLAQQSRSLLPKTIGKDREVLEAARQVLASLKSDPSRFNSGMGFLLVGNLDDASRNMAVCMGQAAMEASTQMRLGNGSQAQLELHIAQACVDASQLLYTVSETAFSLYSQYLLAQGETFRRAMDGLTQCADILKKQHKP